MAVSLAYILANSYLMWMLSMDPLTLSKDHRDTSCQKIVQENYNYDYKSCDDLVQYVDFPWPQNGKELESNFNYNNTFLYKALYGESFDSVDPKRRAVASQLYSQWGCSEKFKGIEKKYETLKQPDLLKFMDTVGRKAVQQELLDRKHDEKVVFCKKRDIQRKRHLR